MRRITPISYLVLVKIFELEEFTVKRQKRDHLIMTKPGVKRPLVIKTSPGDVRPAQETCQSPMYFRIWGLLESAAKGTSSCSTR